MLYKVIDHEQFRRLIDLGIEENEIIGPRQVATRHDGSPIHQFLPIERYEQLDLDYEKTEYSAKTWFLPFREELSHYTMDDGDWEQEIRYRLAPRAIVGLHACDIHALLKLDKVMLRGRFPSPYYKARRANTLIVGIDHEPCRTGFCASVGADIVTHGYDLFLTDLGDRYFVSVNSDRGYRVLTQVPVRDVTEEDRQEFMAERHRIADARKVNVDTRNLPTLLDLTFESEVWKRWGDKCLSCGSCAMVCPTCYCYGVHERADMDFSRTRKIRQLHACTLVDFAAVAGGHDFRPTPEHRLKYRYYHQHRGFVEAYDEPLCVGCNRCGDTCLSGINPPEVIADLQAEEAR